MGDTPSSKIVEKVLYLTYLSRTRYDSTAEFRVTRYQTPYDSFVTRKMANWPRSRLVRWLEGAATGNARVRIATSHSIESIVRENFPWAPPADDIIPNMAENVFTGEPIHGLENRKYLMLFVGRLIPGHKNPDHAAEVFTRIAGKFPDWRIEFAGNDIPLDDNTSIFGYLNAC